MAKKTRFQQHQDRGPGNNAFKKNMVNKKKKSPAKKEPLSHAKHSMDTNTNRSTFNEDRRRRTEEAGGKKTKPLTTAEMGEKKYACLVEECEEIFDTWRTATRHMRNTCPIGRLDEKEKPHITDSRKKANDLLDQGLVEVKTYPDPADEEEVAAAIREFYRKRGTEDNPRKEQHLLKQLVIKHWGPGNFSRFGFGSLAEFCERHGIATATTAAANAAAAAAEDE
jgi:hypothetical protein